MVASRSSSFATAAPVVPDPPTAVAAKPASSSAQVSWTAPERDGDSPLTGQTVTPYLGATAQTPVQVGASATSATVTGLTNGSSYTFRVSATNAVGTGAQSAASAAIVPRLTIFDFATPPIADNGDNLPVEVGVKFQSDVDGFITGIRYYKSAANQGPHTGSLWTATGSRITQSREDHPLPKSSSTTR